MDRYNISRALVSAGSIDDAANALSLWSDIHNSFDAGIIHVHAQTISVGLAFTGLKSVVID